MVCKLFFEAKRPRGMGFTHREKPGEKTEQKIHCQGPGDCHKPEMKWPAWGEPGKRGDS
jgi:hypothetical protein